MALAGSRLYRLPHVRDSVSHPFGPFLPLSRPTLSRARGGSPPTPAGRAQAPTHWQTPDRFLGPASLGLLIQTLAAMPRGHGAGEAGHCHPVASSGLPALLAVAVETPPSRSAARRLPSQRFDSRDARSQSAL